MGSLGFLTPFTFDAMQSSIDSALSGNVALTLRSRLKCILGSTDKSDGLQHVKELENGHSSPSHDLTIQTVRVSTYLVYYLTDLICFHKGKNVNPSYL